MLKLLVQRTLRQPIKKVQVRAMGNRVALCIDSETLNNPRMIGLSDERISSQTWLTLFCDGLEARHQLLHDREVREVWVSSTDNVDMVNLAAALKADNPQRIVCCILFSPNGSLLSRCHAAKIDCILGKVAFLKRYEQFKQRAAYGQSISRSLSSRTKPSQVLRTDEIDIEEPSFGNYRKGAKPEEVSAPLRSQAKLPISKRDSSNSNQKPSKAERIAFNEFKRNESSKEAFVLAVVSGSGGTGKSSVALLSAFYAQRLGKKTLILDADLQFGDIKLLIGKEKSLDVSDVMANPEYIKKLQPEGLIPALLSSPKRLEQSELIVNRMAELINYLKGFFDVIVVNTGAFWSELHAQLLEHADRTLFLLDQRPSSIKACSHALNLCARCGIATQSFVFMLNYVSRQALVSSLDVSCALKGARVLELRDGGRDVSELLGSGLTEELIGSRNPFVESLFTALEYIFPHDGKEHGVVVPKQRLARKRVFNRKKRVACL